MNDANEIYKGDFNNGEFLRPDSGFRHWVKSDGTTAFAAEPGRYHLYVSLACPWSHRVVIVRKLLGLDQAITMSVTSPIWNENGWYFGDEPGTIEDTVNQKRDIIDIYRLANPHFSAEETVPVLWDKKLKTIVSNESRDIMRMFGNESKALGGTGESLCPFGLRKQIDQAIDEIYAPVANGVYQAGFAKTQQAYERAYHRLFTALDSYDEKLSRARYVCGDKLTEADVALFVTLIRFDVVYYSHFKCNQRRITDYKNLWGWVRDIYQTPGVKETTNFVHIKKHYYGSHKFINPTGIIPAGPDLDFESPHQRA